MAGGFAAHPLLRIGGTVTEISSSACRLAGLSHFVKLGECVEIAGGDRPALCEVVRIDAHGVIVKPFDGALEAGLGTMAWARGSVTLSPDPSWKGRTINALGQPIDDLGPLRQGERSLPTDREPPAPMRRQRIRKPMKTGIRVLDLFTPLCAGQRIGIFAGSGVGKSTLLSMLARASGFDTTVLALVGERGREVREFLEDALGRERARTIAVVVDGRREPDDAPPRAEVGDVHRRAFARPGRERAADRRFGDALRPCRARRGPRGRRAARGARLSAERVQRPAQAAGAGGGRRGRRGLDHGRLRRARRRRRPQRSGRRQHPRHARRAHRARPRYRRAGPISARQRALLGLAADQGRPGRRSSRS